MLCTPNLTTTSQALDADGSGELDEGDVAMLRQACKMLEAGTLVLPSPLVAVNASGEDLPQKGGDKRLGEDAGEAGVGSPLPPSRNLPPGAPSTHLALTPIGVDENFDASTAAASVERLSAMYRAVPQILPRCHEGPLPQTAPLP